MIEYTTLDKVPIGLLHKCFTEAFAGYSASARFTPEMMMRMNTMRGVDYAMSMGAFDGKNMVAFVLNGIGMWNGRKTAYDAGTGVIKIYRSSGIAKEIFMRVKELLKKNGIQQYMLEIMSADENAKSLYNMLGFIEGRSLVSMRLSGVPLSVLRQNFKADDAAREKWTALRGTMEADMAMQPSWNNSWDTVMRVPDNFSVKTVSMMQETAGAVIFSPGNGNISQLWVKSQFRATGVGSALIAAVAESSRSGGKLAWLGIDSRAPDVIHFLTGRGFKILMTRCEMRLDIF